MTGVSWLATVEAEVRIPSPFLLFYGDVAVALCI